MKSKINNIIDNLKKTKKNSLRFKVWTYLIIFSILILSFLWLFQVIFLNSFYEKEKVKDINKAASEISNSYNNDIDSLATMVDDLSKDKGVCVQIIGDNETVYDSSSFNRGCLPENSITSYKKDFFSSLSKEKTYKVVNPRYSNEVLIKAIKLDNTYSAFLSISLKPLDSAVTILRKQLIIITIVVFLLAFILAYVISRKISKPIEKINESTKEMQKGNYDTRFYIEEDIDELNELVKSLNQTCKELSKTEELRRELLANISHDLKTPLTMIKAYAEMVRDITYKDKEKRTDNLNVIIDESDRLNLLVNDILELSVIQSDTKHLEKEEFDLTSLINEIVNKYSIYKEYTIEFNCDHEIIVEADPNRIKQVLYNLLNNAINYSDKEKHIWINLLENKDTVKVEVKDSGIGIKEEELKYIWKKYYKVDKTHKRDKVGTGIGLSIVENILLKHHFKYGVESKEGVGTTFWFIMDKK